MSSCIIKLLARSGFLVGFGYSFANRPRRAAGKAAAAGHGELRDKLKADYKTVARDDETAYFRDQGHGEMIMAFGKKRERGPAVRIKLYPQGRLYCLDRLHYFTRADLVAMAQRGEEFMVIDANTGVDVTFSFRPITVEH
jgi:hypothetical protein